MSATQVCFYASQPAEAARWWLGWVGVVVLLRATSSTALPGDVQDPCSQECILLCSCCQVRPAHTIAGHLTACAVITLHVLSGLVVSSKLEVCIMLSEVSTGRALCNLNCTGSSNGHWVAAAVLRGRWLSHSFCGNSVTKSSQPNIRMFLIGFGLPRCAH